MPTVVGPDFRRRCTQLNCAGLLGSPDDIVKIKSLTVFPDPPKPGQNLTVNVSAYVTQVIEVCVDLTVSNI